MWSSSNRSVAPHSTQDLPSKNWALLEAAHLRWYSLCKSRFLYDTWTRQDLNLQPPACKADAQPLCYGPLFGSESLERDSNPHYDSFVGRCHIQLGDLGVGSHRIEL